MAAALGDDHAEFRQVDAELGDQLSELAKQRIGNQQIGEKGLFIAVVRGDELYREAILVGWWN